MNNMNDDFHQSSKQNRRENLKHKKKIRMDVEDTHKISNKITKEFKNKKSSIREEELWEDWENYE